MTPPSPDIVRAGIGGASPVPSDRRTVIREQGECPAGRPEACDPEAIPVQGSRDRPTPLLADAAGLPTPAANRAPAIAADATLARDLAA